MISIFISTYKKNILQFIGLIITYLVTKNNAFIVLFAFFSLLILLFPKIYFQISNSLDLFINYIGKTIKSALFFLVFILIIIPVSVLKKTFKKQKQKNETHFIEINTEISSEDLVKMW